MEFLAALEWAGLALYSPGAARMLDRLEPERIRPQQMQVWEERKWIIRRKDERSSDWIITLTEEGRRMIGSAADVEQKINLSWDKKWRVLTFDIPRGYPGSRKRLIQWLREHDFTLLQGSVWISPWGQEDSIPQAKSGLASPLNVILFESDHIIGLNDRDIVDNAWDWNAISARHHIYRQQLRMRPSRNKSSDEWKSWLAEEQEQWRAILRQEALLPKDLQPASYPMRQTIRLRNKAIKASSGTGNA